MSVVVGSSEKVSQRKQALGRTLKEEQVEMGRQGVKNVMPAEGTRLNKGVESEKPHGFREWRRVQGRCRGVAG